MMSDPVSPSGAADAAQHLEAGGARLLACSFVDGAGVDRVKAVPIGRLESVHRNGIGISETFATFAVDDHIADGAESTGPSGDMRLVPDLAAAVVLHGTPGGWAWAPVDQVGQDLSPMPHCPREALRHASARLAAQGLAMRAAFEVEFTLFGLDGQPAHRGPGYSVHALIDLEEVLLDLTDALHAQGADVQTVHPEYAMGQCEVSTGVLDPLGAADRLVMVRHTIRRVARRHGLRACTAPIAVHGEVANGCHLHLSLWRDDINLCFDSGSGMTPEAGNFAAGLVAHLPAATALYAPSVPSYQRLQPSNWAGAFACWGWENREAAVRAILGPTTSRDRSANLELKCVDPSANPYIAVAAAIHSGLDGIGRQLPLPDPVQVDPATLSAEQLSEAGIVQLPSTLGLAIDTLVGSTVLRDELGKGLLDSLLATRIYEWKTFGAMPDDELAAIHRWRH